MPPARLHLRRCRCDWREEHRIRRYGFHGTSYAFVSRAAAAELLGRPVEDTNLVVLHLGNGASAAAVRGRSVGRHLDGADARSRGW